MNRLLITLALTTLTVVSFGQKTKLVDLKKIEKVANTETYDQLFKRFLENDTTLTIEDYCILYYGEAYKSSYKPKARHDSIRVLNSYLSLDIDSIDFEKVLDYTKLILDEFPFNLDQIFITAITYNELGKEDLSVLWFYKYDKLLMSILNSGNGKSRKTAFIVTKVPDEYTVIDALGLIPKGQGLIRKGRKLYDALYLHENDFGINSLYFDINLFFYHNR